MARRRDTGWSDLARLQGRFLELLEQALGGLEEGPGEGGPDGSWQPCLDLVETEGHLILFAELPGVHKSDVELQAQARWLELSGRRQTVEGEHRFARLERSYGRFRRRIELPEVIDPDRIEARLAQGVLEVRMPRQRAGARVEIDEA